MTMTSVLLKIGSGRTAVETAGKKATLDHVGEATQLCLLWKPERRKSPITKEMEQCQCTDCLRGSTVQKSSRADKYL